MPAFWWHEVDSEPDETHKNIAVNFWHTPIFDKEFPCAECRLAYNRDKYEGLLYEFGLVGEEDLGAGGSGKSGEGVVVKDEL